MHAQDGMVSVTAVALIGEDTVDDSHNMLIPCGWYVASSSFRPGQRPGAPVKDI